jgi:2-oxoglutarate dehydrogenase complex dehydrogenase (E1) component-like enzyme
MSAVAAGPDYPATTIVSAVAPSLIHAKSEAQRQGVIDETLTEFRGLRGRRADGTEVVITYPGEQV